MQPCLELANNILGVYRLRSFVATNMEHFSPAPGQFYGYRSQIRYMNGRGEVYETNITDPGGVLFLPVGQKHSGSGWEPVLFRKLHKIEWLFE